MNLHTKNHCRWDKRLDDGSLLYKKCSDRPSFNNQTVDIICKALSKQKSVLKCSKQEFTRFKKKLFSFTEYEL